jgi:hypothetical protein
MQGFGAVSELAVAAVDNDSAVVVAGHIQDLPNQFVMIYDTVDPTLHKIEGGT